jgi:hypothetical protein
MAREMGAVTLGILKDYPQSFAQHLDNSDVTKTMYMEDIAERKALSLVNETLLPKCVEFLVTQEINNSLILFHIKVDVSISAPVELPAWLPNALIQIPSLFPTMVSKNNVNLEENLR